MTKTAEVVRKISLAAMGLGTEAKAVRKLDNGTSKPLYRVYGIAGGTKTGTSDFGEWTALIGQFEAQRLHDGALFHSSKLFLPAFLTEMVTGQLTTGAENVKFAFEVSAVSDDTSQLGYKFGAKPLIKPAKNDAVAELRSQIASEQLEAPKEQAKIEAPAIKPVDTAAKKK